MSGRERGFSGSLGTASPIGQRLRLALGAPDGARTIPTPPGGWPVLDGSLVSTVCGPFLGLEGPGFEKAWYVVALDIALPGDFDPFHTLRDDPLTGPADRVLLRPDMVDPPPPHELRALPGDVIGDALTRHGRARVSVYAAPKADALPAHLTLGALKAGTPRWLCAAWAELLANCS